MWLEIGILKNNKIIDSRCLFCLYEKENSENYFSFKVGIPNAAEHEIHMNEISPIFSVNITLLSQHSHKGFLSIFNIDLQQLTVFVRLWKAPFGTKYNLLSEMFFPAADLQYQRAKTENKKFIYHFFVTNTKTILCWTVDIINCKRETIFV
jgi:hypothetical protein